MKLKRITSAVMAAVMAVTSAVVCEVTASAAYDNTKPFILLDSHTDKYNYNLREAKNVSGGTSTYTFSTTCDNWDSNLETFTLYFYDLDAGVFTDAKLTSFKVGDTEIISDSDALSFTNDGTQYDLIADTNVSAGNRYSIDVFSLITTDGSVTIPASKDISIDVEVTYVSVTPSATADKWETNSDGKWQLTRGTAETIPNLEIDLADYTDLDYANIQTVTASLVVTGGGYANGCLGLNDTDSTWKSGNWSASAPTATVAISGVEDGFKPQLQVWYAQEGDTIVLDDITVTGNVPVTKVELNKTTLELVEGAFETLTATVSPDNATDTTVTWTSSATDVATVDNTGKVTAVKAGTAKITAAAGEESAECTVTVSETAIPVKTVTITKPEKTEYIVDDTVTLTAAVNADANVADKTISWRSSDETVATVKNGKVTFLKAADSVKITAYYSSATADAASTIEDSVDFKVVDYAESNVKYDEIAKKDPATIPVKVDNAACELVVISVSEEDANSYDYIDITVTPDGGTPITVRIKDLYKGFKFTSVKDELIKETGSDGNYFGLVKINNPNNRKYSVGFEFGVAAH